MCRYTYVSIDEAINDLQVRGFSKDFFLLDDHLFCRQQNKVLRNREFDILETYYFPRGEMRLIDMMLYGIECPDHCMKGILLVAGKKNQSVMPEMLHRKLTEELMQYRHAGHTELL